MALHTSKACCELPPVQAKEYKTQGHYKDFAGTKCYITGPSDANKALFFVYDICGYTPQTLQGADILATTGKYLVVMPDFFHGKPAQASWFGDNASEEEQAKRDAFVGKLSFKDKADQLFPILEHVKATYSTVHAWGVIGYCWGGKLAVLTSKEKTPWKVGLQTSPAGLDPNDAPELTIPFATLGSKDEAAETVSAFGEAQRTPKLVKHFNDQVHGWMSARGDLENPEVLKQYEKGYQLALEFFAQHL
ncbi:carboxymethylenebutenolidase [Myriangium duriaei CBS 260.36]|uniref:Carboxymethylenebutenolidase n=1 Tax=Myriangium duriaei CBS 260.36 TaxID=1168546 RepID=A0A9P4J0L4_9PEZI|nr:carboxymethylenebutenolidase [Myriangium duriaei CBS 260.36]